MCVGLFALMSAQCGKDSPGMDAGRTSGGNDAGGSPFDAGSAALTGTIDGQPFVVRSSALAVTRDWKSGFYPGTSTVILLSDTPDICGEVVTGSTSQNSHLLILNLGENRQGTSNPVASPGTFPQSNSLVLPRASQIFFNAVDATCGFHKVSITGGSVSVTSVDADPARLQGTLTAHSPDGVVHGDFLVTTSCPTAAVDKYLNDSPHCSTLPAP